MWTLCVQLPEKKHSMTYVLVLLSIIRCSDEVIGSSCIKLFSDGSAISWIKDRL